VPSQQQNHARTLSITLIAQPGAIVPLQNFVRQKKPMAPIVTKTGIANQDCVEMKIPVFQKEPMVKIVKTTQTEAVSQDIATSILVSAENLVAGLYVVAEVMLIVVLKNTVQQPKSAKTKKLLPTHANWPVNVYPESARMDSAAVP